MNNILFPSSCSGECFSVTKWEPRIEVPSPIRIWLMLHNSLTCTKSKLFQPYFTEICLPYIRAINKIDGPKAINFKSNCMRHLHIQHGYTKLQISMRSHIGMARVNSSVKSLSSENICYYFLTAGFAAFELADGSIPRRLFGLTGEGAL